MSVSGPDGDRGVYGISVAAELVGHGRAEPAAV